jgi:monofunctional biosynthetic peptidoglycan transglycosylase
LPAPKRFERRPDSPFLLGRAATVAARMGDVSVP